MWTTLIPAAELANAGAGDLLIVDTRFDLAAPEAGRRTYAAAHIPGAVYAHLDEDLAGPVTAGTGRHPLPDPDALAARLGAWGLGEHTQLVAYDDGSGAYAARLWWLARWLGHEAAAVLDGGLAAWRALDLPLTAEVPRPMARRLVARPRHALALSTGELATRVASGEVLLLDARAPQRFRGEVEPIDAVAGHVPGARNHPFQENLGPEGRFLPPSDLRARYAATLAGRDAGEVVCMCGSGVTACHNLLALEHAGLTGARLYPGSWSEWIRDSKRPVATGPQ